MGDKEPPKSADELLKRYSEGEREFTGADLEHAQLVLKDLKAAVLVEANLTRANLIHADFTGANLERAILTEAKLQDTILQRAILTDADLKGAQYSSETKFPLDFDPEKAGMKKVH